MKRLRLILTILIAISTYATYGQSGKYSISGTITDEIGQGLPGATVVENNSTNATITDIDGKYSLMVSDKDAVIKVSFIGYETHVENIKGRANLNVKLKGMTHSLDDIVVVGYGTMNKSDVTGSISSIAEKDEVARQYSSVDQLLQGRASGIQVSGNSGNPGGNVSVRIRGTNSLRGNNEPLYVVDGIIISTAGTDVANASGDSNELQSRQNGLAGINPRDIESMEVLKDASATAIYGSRGANGVVIITTKSGSSKDGQPTVEAFATMQVTTVASKIDMLDGIGYAEYINAQDPSKPIYSIEAGEVYKISYDELNNAIISGIPQEQVDWQDEIYQMSLSYNAGASLSGGKGGNKYYLSAGYANQKGIVETTDIKRGDIRFNFNRDIGKKFGLTYRSSLAYNQGSFAQGGSKSGGNRSFTKQILAFKPLVSSLGESETDLDLGISNPYAWLTDYDERATEKRVDMLLAFDYDIIKGLNFKVSAAVDYRGKDRTRFYNTGVFLGQRENGLANYSNLNRYHYVFEGILSYSKTIAKKHRINAMVGATSDGINSNNSIYEIANFSDKSLGADYPQGGQTVYTPYSILWSDEQILSTLARVNYSFNGKYIITGTFRSDTSSKFAKENQTGYFPSLSLAWRAMEESFIANLDIFYNLKFRMGYGLTGNQSINPYQTLQTYETSYYPNTNNSNEVAYVPSRIANKDLTWETSEQYNVGVDMGFFQGRLNATVDAYYKTTKDLLQQVTVGNSTGFYSIFMNRGEIYNKGIEFSIDGVMLERKDFKLTIGGNMSFNRNKVGSLGLSPQTVWKDGKSSEEVYFLGSNVSGGTYFKQPANIFMEGQPMGMFWGWETDGIYKSVDEAASGPIYSGNPNQAGDVRFVDQNGDGVINDLDKTIIGDPNPDFTYGLNINMTYKNWDLNLLFDGSHGANLVNGYNMEIDYAEPTTKNIRPEAYYGAWSELNPSASHPRLGYDLNEFFTDRIVEDASYFRLNNVNLGYNIYPKSKSISKLYIYGSVMNAFTITNFSGYDPQVGNFSSDGTVQGVDWTGSPATRTFLFGVNLTF